MGRRVVSGLSFVSEFPGPLAALEEGAGSVVAFERVRVFFRRADGSIALDRMVNFAAGQQQVELELSLTLSSNAPSTGEEFSLFLRYINAAGDTVFAGGPVPVMAVPRRASDPPPPPAQVPLTYTGPGSSAVAVAMDQDTITVVAGDPFTFTAVASDANESPVAAAPLVFTVLDPTRATLAAVGAGAGTSLAARGIARVRVALAAGGAADTSYLVVLPKAGSLQVLAGNSQTGSVNATLTDSLVVRVLATDLQPMSGVPVSITVASGGGAVSADTLVSDSLGTVRFTWTLGAAVGAQSLTIGSLGLASVTATATGTADGPAALVVTQQPADTTIAGSVLAPLIVQVRNAAAAVVTSFNDSVAVALGTNPGGGATLGGRVRVAAVAGIATFDSLTLTKAGSYTLSLSVPGTPAVPATATGTFHIKAAAPSSLVLTQGGGQSAAPGTALPTAIQVRLIDQFSNGVRGASISFTPRPGAVATPPSATTDSTGHASTVWTLADTAGAQTLTVRAVGAGIDSLDVQANVGTGPIATTDVTPALDTLVSIGETQLLVATSKDIALNSISGSYVWSSSAPGVASVDSTGLVTAVAPGSTWIHAIESGGTRDSARVVVDQRLASVIVTPGSRSIYLGASYDFAASAVDGLGVPMLVQPTFVWTVQSTSIASIDTAGVVVGVGLGSTQVHATASGIQGVATLTVLTAITRIAVLRDSIGFSTTDTFTLVALGRSRSYRAVAYDTLDAPMSGITFVWESSNPSVAPFDSTGTATARAVGVANGITAIRAGAQGVVGAASLRVQQVLASITLSPPAASISATGVTLITARGRDPDGYYLSSLSGVTFASNNTPVATVNASSGLVTGVANGTALITATKDAITSDTATITVGGAVPAIISFGRDTLSIGRSASLSIPIYLSKPHTSAVTVNLAVVDTFAFFSQASISIPAGATSGNATLNGRSAGITQIIATDGGGGGAYAGDSAQLRVQASVRFSSTNYSLVATNEVATQILLTDPSPAGGTYVTYGYSIEGRVAISPDPAFIPVGQLSANVVIEALAGGGAVTVTPSATGVSGQSSTVTTYAATLDAAGSLYRLGAGQHRSDAYVQTQSTITQSLPVTLTSSDSNVVSVPAGIVIPGGSYYAYYQAIGKTPGSAYIRATAPGFTSDSVLFVVTTPHAGICCSTGRTTTSPASNFTVYSRDSIGNNYQRVTPLVVSLSTSDTSVVRLLATTAVIAANASSSSTPSFEPAGEIGSAWIRSTAPGHRPDSMLVTVSGPKLSFSFTSARVGLDQKVQSVYVSIPNNTVNARTVYLQNTNPAVAQLPDSVIIPAGSYYQYFDIGGVGLGDATFFATTAGHEPDTATFRVTTPRLVQGGGGTYDNFRPPINISTTVTDSVGNGHARLTPLVLTYVSTDTNVIRVSPTATIAANAQSVSTATVTFIGVGTAQVIVSAAGHMPDTTTFTVRVPKLSLSFTTFRIGRRQLTSSTAFYVSVPNNVTDTLPVTLTQSNAAIDSLTTLNPNIPAGTYYQYFGTAALATGVDTIIASAPNYLPDTAVVTITSTRLVVGSLPSTRTTTSPPSNFAIYSADSVGSQQASLDTILVAVRSTNAAVVQPLANFYRILPGASSVTASAAFVGPGTGEIIVSDSLGTGYAGDTTNTVTVTGPSLSLYNGSPKLGMRQNNGSTGAYVSTPDNVTGSPLVVYLASTDPAVASVPDSVIIPVGTYYAYFQITAHDVVGTIQINATALGYSPASVNQQVTAPRFTISTSTSVRTTQPATVVSVSATDADGVSHLVNEPVVVTLASSSGAVGTIDSATVTIATNTSSNSTARFQPLTAGTTQLSATDARVESYRYNSGLITVAVTTPAISAPGGVVSLGIGQYVDDYVYLPDYQTVPRIVTLAHRTSASATPDTVTIDVGQYYRLFRTTALSAGADTVIFSASAHLPDTTVLSVGLGRIDGLGNWQSTLSQDSVQVWLYTRAPNTAQRSVTANTTFTLSADAHLQFVSGGAGSTPITSVTVPADASVVTFWVKRVSAGVANVSITNANYTPYNTTVVVNAP